MPSSWLEDDEYEAWCAEAEPEADTHDEARHQQSNHSANVNGGLSAASQQHWRQQPSTGQAEPTTHYAGSYAPYAELDSATLDGAPVTPFSTLPPDDIGGGRPPGVARRYSAEGEGEGQGDAEVSVSGFGSPSGPRPEPEPHDRNHQPRPSDMDSLFGDSASEAAMEEVSSWVKARTQNGNDTGTTAATPDTSFPPPRIPVSIPVSDPNIDVDICTRSSDSGGANATAPSSSPSNATDTVTGDAGAGADAGESVVVGASANASTNANPLRKPNSSTLLRALFTEQGWAEHDRPCVPPGTENPQWEDDPLELAKQRRDARREFQPDPTLGFVDVLGPVAVGGEEGKWKGKGKGKDTREAGEPGGSVGFGSRSGDASFTAVDDSGNDGDANDDGDSKTQREEKDGDGGGGHDGNKNNVDQPGQERKNGRGSPAETQDSVHDEDDAEKQGAVHNEDDAEGAYHCIPDGGDETKENERDQEQDYSADEHHHHNHHVNHDEPHSETQHQDEAERGGEHQDRSQVPDQTSSDEDDPWPPRRPETIDILSDSKPWAHLRDRYNPEEDDPYWKPAGSPPPKPKPQGFAQYATQSKSTWAPLLRPLSADEKDYACLLYYERLKREGRGPYTRDKRGPALEGEAEQLSEAGPDERREMVEERAWRAREIKRRRKAVFFGEHFGKGGPHDSNLWGEEQSLYMMDTIDLEVEALVEETRAKKRREKETQEKKMHEEEEAEVKGKDEDDNNGQGSPEGGDTGSCVCPCGGETSNCSCHPLYCPCSSCDHTEQAEQLRKEAELKWGEGEGNAQAPTETAKQHGACCGGANTQQRCVCLPGLCSCAGCEEHYVGHGQPRTETEAEAEMELPSTHSGLWPRIPESERLFKLAQKRVPGENHDCPCSANGACHCPAGRCNCRKPLSAPDQWGQPQGDLPLPTFPRTASTWPSGQFNHPPHEGLTQGKAASRLPEAPPSVTGGFLHPTAAATSIQAPVATFSRQSPVPPSRPDTPRPPADSGASTSYDADVLRDFVRQSAEPELMLPSQADVRQSVEPEYPPPDWTRDSTPAYEDRSLTPSPFSNHGDVEMRDASGSTIVPSTLGRDVAVTAPDLEPDEHRSRSPERPLPPPVPESPIKQPKRGDRRKSGVQGSKVKKRSTTGTKTKPKSRNVTQKPTQSVGKLVEQAKKGNQDAGQEEGSLDSDKPIKPAPKAGGKVAEAVRNIERQVLQQEQDLKQKDGSQVRRSARANKGVRTSLGYGSPK